MLKTEEMWREYYPQNYADRPADVFHIGYHKTGTTFLQRHVIPHIGGVSIFSNEEMSGTFFKENKDIGEILFHFNPNAKVIVVIRSHYTLYPSYYYLYLKGGGKKTFADFVSACTDAGKFNYMGMYRNLLEYFPEDRIKILFYEDIKADEQDFVNEFVSFCTGDRMKKDFAYENRQHKTNKSPHDSVFTFLRIINAGGFPKSMRISIHKGALKFNRFLREINLFNGRFSLSEDKDFQNRILHFYGPSNNDLAEVLHEDLGARGYPLTGQD